jgi:phosphoglycerate kinase
MTNTLHRSALRDWNIAGKRVILRADFNVPLNYDTHDTHKTTIIDDFRLRSLLPTIDLILQKQGSIILITHMGRPKKPTPSLSTSLLVPWFKEHNYDIAYAATPAQVGLLHSPIILLENTRFFPGEKNQDPLFAQELASLGNYYVNDGFGVMHRKDTSIAIVPLLFSPEKRTYGLLVEKELNMLTSLMKKPKKPFVLIVGGAKVAEKIALIEHMLPVIDSILLCPPLVFTFNKALGKPIGNSLVDTTALNLCTRIMHEAHAKNIPLLFPSDYRVTTTTLDGPLLTTETDSIQKNETGVSIGPKTATLFEHTIQSAGTIFFNGAMGFINKPETMRGMNALLEIIAQAQGTSIIAGGDSVAAVCKHGLKNHIDYLSTGGGSALAYMSGQQLPGLEALKKRAKT